MTDDFTLKEGKQNPSRWSHRKNLMSIAFIGFCIALYLGLYQLHLFNFVWDPLFGSGSQKVLFSSFSKKLPIPDALIGAISYVFDMIVCLIGDENRWKTKPWITIALGVAVTLFAISSLFLVGMQAFVIHAFCTLCICSAAISIIIFWPATAEMRATIEYLTCLKKQGIPILKALW